MSRTPYDTKNGTEVVWVNKTVQVQWIYRIYAVDNGNPRRGDFIPVNITINSTCASEANFVINDTTGNVFLRAPKLTGYRKYIIYAIFICITFAWDLLNLTFSLLYQN